jgi:pimeloyl-ACP methyl ester carboxylesterase
MYFNSSFGKIYFNIEGNGDPLILIHGTPFSSIIWESFVEVLKFKFTVYTYDLLGYGNSGMSETDVSLGVQNEILTQLIDHWNIKEPDVIAHDFGGQTILRAVTLNKISIKKLLLIDPVALSPWGSPLVQYVKKYESVFNQIPDYIHEAMVTAYVKDALYTDVSPEKIRSLVLPWLGEKRKSAFYRQIAQMDVKYTEEVENLYEKINATVKILWGENDNWIPVEKGKELHSKIKNSEFVLIPNAGHLAQFDNPEFILREALEFFI